MDCKGALPIYSDRIVQDLHLIPFSAQIVQIWAALNALYGIVRCYYSIA